MTNFEYLRERLHKQAGLFEVQSRFKPTDYKKLQRTEWSNLFEKLMRNRLIMGALRYGTLEDKKINAKQNRWNLLQALQSKIESYEQTGNTEYLVDAANYCLLAFECDPHPNKHFHALDNHHDHCRRKPLNSDKRN